MCAGGIADCSRANFSAAGLAAPFRRHQVGATMLGANGELAAIVMAGGRSERMRAGGSPEHKGLRTVRGAPLIEWNLRALSRFGFHRPFVAVSARERGLMAWLEGPGRVLCPDPEVLVEQEPLGTIGAVSLLPTAIENAVVVNVDNLTTLDLRDLFRTHLNQGAAATIATHTQPFRIPFGLLELEGNRVTAYREKPHLPVTISSGTYVLHRRAIARVRRGRRTDVPWLIAALLQGGEQVAAHPHRDIWIDVND